MQNNTSSEIQKLARYIGDIAVHKDVQRFAYSKEVNGKNGDISNKIIEDIIIGNARIGLADLCMIGSLKLQLEAAKRLKHKSTLAYLAHASMLSEYETFELVFKHGMQNYEFHADKIQMFVHNNLYENKYCCSLCGIPNEDAMQLIGHQQRVHLKTLTNTYLPILEESSRNLKNMKKPEDLNVLMMDVYKKSTDGSSCILNTFQCIPTGNRATIVCDSGTRSPSNSYISEVSRINNLVSKVMMEECTKA